MRLGHIGTITDITDRKIAEAILREKHSETIINNLPGFYLYDAAGHFVKWNKISRVSGFSAEEIAQMEAVDFMTPILKRL
jgi:PAS domain S-box-containing protein